MAELIGEIPLAPLTVSAATSYWLWQVVAPAHQKVKISAYFVGQDYNTNGTPGLLELFFCGAAGSGGTSATPVAVDQDDTETFQSTCQTNLSVAPTSLTLIRNCYINPQVSVPEYLPLKEEIKVKGGGIFAVRFTAEVSGHVAGWLRLEE